MKRFIKVMVNVIAVAMVLVMSLSLVGCNKKVQVEFELAIYDYANHEYYEDTTLTVTLHGDYASQTVEAIKKYVEEGYYNDAIFYGMDGNKIMVGDLKMDADGNIYQNTVKPEITGEFEHGAVKGSDLKVEEGSIALWRNWYERDGYATSASLNTGRATMFIPTTSISEYDEWFCVFATIDMEDETNSTTIRRLKSAVKSDSDTYEVFYTGEYDAEKDGENNGLTFNCLEEVPEDAKVFVPKGEQYTCYAQYQIKVAKGAGNACGAKIVSAKII